MLGSHIAFVPVRFGMPPASRDWVHEQLSGLPGWNSLERLPGDPDASVFELRLDTRPARPAAPPLFAHDMRNGGPYLRNRETVKLGGGRTTCAMAPAIEVGAVRPHPRLSALRGQRSPGA